MVKVFGFFRAFAVLVMAVTATLSIAIVSAAAQDKSAPGTVSAGGAQSPVLLLDRAAVWRDSKAGQDITQQEDALTQAAQNELGKRRDALENEGRALQQQAPTLAPDVRMQRIAAYRGKLKEFEQTVQARQNLIDGGVMKARLRVQRLAVPILRSILRDHGAAMIFDRASTLKTIGGIDITTMVVQRLDRQLPGIKVQPGNPPAGPTDWITSEVLCRTGLCD